jgi:hypothetical protein
MMLEGEQRVRGHTLYIIMCVLLYVRRRKKSCLKKTTIIFFCVLCVKRRLLRATNLNNFTMETRTRRRTLGKGRSLAPPPAPAAESGTATSDKSDEEEVVQKPSLPAIAEDPAERRKKIMTRTVMACAMIAFYMIMINAGHLYCILVGVLVQV